MRKYKRELSVTEAHVAAVSLTHPYLPLGVCEKLFLPGRPG